MRRISRLFPSAQFNAGVHIRKSIVVNELVRANQSTSRATKNSLARGTAEASTLAHFQLESQLKIGQFGFSEQDLVIPVSGIPLTVTRTYNSLNPRSGDFGYAWKMALNSMDVQLDEQRQPVTIGTDEAPFADVEEDANNLPLVVSLRVGGGWDVTLTLPDGRRTT